MTKHECQIVLKKPASGKRIMEFWAGPLFRNPAEFKVVRSSERFLQTKFLQHFVCYFPKVVVSLVMPNASRGGYTAASLFEDTLLIMQRHRS